MPEEPNDNPSSDLTPSKKNGSGQPSSQQVVLQAINHLTAMWAQSIACRIEQKQLGVMVTPVPGRPGMVRPTGDMQMIFTFKMPPKVIG